MNVCGSKFWTLVDAVANGGEVETVSVLGVPDPQSEDRSDISEAAQVARGADTVVLAVGTDLNSAKEGHDANSISLTEAQEVLIEQVADVAKKPVIVVVMTATPPRSLECAGQSEGWGCASPWPAQCHGSRCQ